jgi:hypothetical protein
VTLHKRVLRWKKSKYVENKSMYNKKISNYLFYLNA